MRRAVAGLVGRAGSLGVERSTGAVKEALVVIGLSVLAANKVNVSLALRALAEIFNDALSIIILSLAGTVQQTDVVVGLGLGRTNRFLDRRTSAGAFTQTVLSDQNAGTGGSNTVVLIVVLVNTADWSRSSVTRAGSGGDWSDIVGNSARTRESEVKLGRISSDSIINAKVHVGDSIRSANRVVGFNAFSCWVNWVTIVLVLVDTVLGDG